MNRRVDFPSTGASRRTAGACSETSRKARRPSLAALLLLGAGCAPPPEPAPIPVVELTIPELHAALAEGRTTCRMVVQAHLDRIAAYDDSTGLNAITVVNPRALARADSADAAQAAGEDPGPLHCVPMLVKDNFDTRDLVTTGGSIALAGNLPPDDAFMVRRIRDAGAIVIAKTNMAEWAFSPRQSVSSSFGRTANAYDLGRTPAGSSGGTASGVAVSFGVVGLGSDTGNSIRGPSSHLALVGIRATLGLTSRDGVIPLAFDRDVAGPMGRTVADVARVFEVVAGYDPGDPYTEHGRAHRADDYSAFLDSGDPLAGVLGRRIGVLRALADPENADSAVLARFDRAIEDLRAQGAEIVDPFEVENLDEHLGTSTFCRRFRYDMAQYLASLEAPPITDVMTVLETGDYGEDVEDGLRFFGDGPLDVHPAEADPPCPDFFDHPGRQAFLADVIASMDSARVDAFVYPSWTVPPAPIDRANEEYRGDNSQLVVPATGLPGITVPMGFTYGDLPAGLQIVGRPYGEVLLLELAWGYEQATGHRRGPDGFPELAREPDAQTAPTR